jgi:hypothetical protein
MKLRGTLNAVAGLMILASLTYCSYGYLTAEGRVKAKCASIPAGSDLSALREFANAHGLTAPSGHSEVEILVETRTFGRYGCRVYVKDGVVQSVQYEYAG